MRTDALLDAERAHSDGVAAQAGLGVAALRAVPCDRCRRRLTFYGWLVGEGAWHQGSESTTVRIFATRLGAYVAAVEYTRQRYAKYCETPGDLIAVLQRGRRFRPASRACVGALALAAQHWPPLARFVAHRSPAR